MSSNPWIPTPTVDAPPATDQPVTAEVPVTGAVGPQPSVTAVDRADRLGEYVPSEPAGLWVVGTHGGAGESTVAELTAGAATSHRWPRREPVAPVLLVARTHASGMRRAQLAMRAWAAGQTPTVRMLGLVLISDAPGRLPKPLEATAQTIGGGVPHIWRLPWIEDLRLTDPSEARLPRQATKVLAEIRTVLENNR